MVPRSLSAFAEELTGRRTAPQEGGREQQPRRAAVFCGCLQSGVAWGTLAGRSSLCHGRMPRRVLQGNEDQLEQRHRSGNRAVNSVLVVRMKVWLHCSKRCLELQRGWKFRHRGRKNDGVTDGYINHTETQTSLRSEFLSAADVGTTSSAEIFLVCCNSLLNRPCTAQPPSHAAVEYFYSFI